MEAEMEMKYCTCMQITHLKEKSSLLPSISNGQIFYRLLTDNRKGNPRKT